MKISKNIFYIFLVLFVLSFILNLFFIFKQFKSIFLSKRGLVEVTIDKVIDGDTIDTATGERLRLYENNSPEYPKDCLGIDAKTRIEDLVLYKKVFIERFGKDNFGRTLAYVFLNKLLVNNVMAEEGMTYYTKGKVLTENSLLIEQSQEKAKLAGRGVWSSFCQTKKEGCNIKGNYRAAENTRIYHTPDCYNYDKITIKSGTSDRWFCNEEEAKKFGFRKSSDCPK